MAEKPPYDVNRHKVEPLFFKQMIIKTWFQIILTHNYILFDINPEAS